MRRFLGALALTALIVGTVAPAATARQPIGAGGVTVRPLTANSHTDANKSASGQLAKSDPALLARRDSAMVNVMVKLDVDAAASYTGGVNGLAATSPSVTGKTLKENSGAVGAYQRYVDMKITGAQRAAQRAVPQIKLGRTFNLAYGGFSARMPANQAKQLLGVPGVAAVQYDTVNRTTANDSPIFVGATQVWPSMGGENKAGKGVKLGVLDTGIWPEHPMLADPGIPFPGGGPYLCDFGASGDTYDSSFSCNDKLIGSYAFLETNLDVNGPDTDEYCNSADNDNPNTDDCSARDADGHGTHTSTTAAGSPVDHSVLLGVDRGHISGLAPGASVIMYRVCDSDGCYSSDSVDAVEQAMMDDVDVLNFSISGGSSAYTDAVELAFLDAYAAGIMVNASAGNSGPGAATSDHAGPWTNTVGASTLNRAFSSTLHLTADGGATLNLTGSTVTGGISSATPVVMGLGSPAGEYCDTEPSPGDYTGVVVACRRGGNARIEKGYFVLQGGAAGMILYNVAQTDQETDNHFLPAIHVNDPSETIKAFVTGHTNVRATWAAGVAGPAQGDVMASFSSRGPLGDFIKPDVTAPGVQILAGESPHHLFSPADGLGPNDEYYQAIAGTSMSSPHAAGVAALIKANHPNWTPGQIKSAMMTSSLQSVLKEDGSTPANPFDRGAGSIRVNRAVNPTVTFDVKAPAFYSSAGDAFGRINLNIASINAPSMAGLISATRTAKNVTNVTQTLHITASMPNNVTGTIVPSTLVLAPGQALSFKVTIDASKKPDGQYFGQIKLDPAAAGYNNAILPVAFNKEPGVVTLSNSCDDTSLTKGDSTSCEVTVTNYANDDAHVRVQVKGPDATKLKLSNWVSDNPPAANQRGNGFIWSGTLSPALPPEILSLTPPGYGYVSMPGLGVGAEAAYDDEQIGLYDLPVPFWYGHEAYNQFGVDSNGYLVAGFVEGEDNNCCDPIMPDPTRPNNVLAPYWTDLDPSSGGDIYVALLNYGGGVYYYVIEWHQVPVYGTTNERTFQIWLGAGNAGEDTSFEYCIDPNGNAVNWTTEFGCDDAAPGLLGAGASDGLVVGAENRDGSDAATIGPIDTQPSNVGYKVITGSPTAGGSNTVHYDVKAKAVGTWSIKATMDSDVTAGTAKTWTKFHVAP